ncbi:DUF421 domain-containing protein [Alloscardovia theropitheci]|uniref:DUF421 domain-containing protein n=1 Tax=Alloscardovia theropitheci TaxID=2496842 RepID=A0A4R0QZ52_9BIFI|nr:DUF421 domain-containing protein [Alloscardovia theropitheci]TCD55031.1 DUF421 domain-containing protein [Alloscardovia theropitheci]
MTGLTLVAVKLLVGFIGLVAVINISGKGNLAPRSATDAVQNYVLGGIIGGVIYNDDIGVTQLVLILIIWLGLVVAFRELKKHSIPFKEIIDGKALTIVRDGHINIKNCKRAKLSASELSFKLRSEKIYSVLDVKRVILEQNGEFIIVKEGEEKPRYPLITDGQVHDDILDLIGHDRVWLKGIMQDNGYRYFKEVFLCEYDSGNMVFVGYKEKKDSFRQRLIRKRSKQ